MGAEPAVIALLSLVFTVLSVILGLVIRAAARWTRLEDKLADLTGDLERSHRELSEQMREDRRATNERLTYLERWIWPRSGGRAR